MTAKRMPRCELGTQRNPHPIEDVKKYRYVWWYGSPVAGLTGKETTGWLCRECAIIHRGTLMDVQPNRQVKFEREREEEDARSRSRR